MGRYNSIYFDGDFLPIGYRNVYAISFNGSSTIIIRVNHSSSQNVAVFIIPDSICNQHSFYAMSKNIFRVEIKSKSVDYNIHACGFSPSFLTNMDRKVTFGYKKQINGNAHIFYGFNSNSQAVSMKTTNSASQTVKYSTNNKIKPNNLNFFNADSNIQNDRPNILTNINSPGFLYSHSIEAETQTFSDINTTYYIAYKLNQTTVKAKLNFKQEYNSKSEDKVIDNSMLTSHFDFLLYYDKETSKFIYDDDWASSVEISYSGSMWEAMKRTWVAVISTFSLVFIAIMILKHH